MSSPNTTRLSLDQAIGQASVEKTCPECAGDIAIDGYEHVCVECGLVIGAYWIEHGWESYSNADPNTPHGRTGAPLTAARHDRGLSSEIGSHQDANGSLLSDRRRRSVRRMRIQHNRARFRSKAERNLSHGFTDIDRIRSALEAPLSVRDRACVLFRRAQHKGLLHGRSIEAIAAGSVYAACREHGWLRSLEEVTEMSAVTIPEVRNAYRVICAELGVTTAPPRVHEFVPRVAGELVVTGRARRRALELAQLVERTGLDSGMNPAGFAAACVYVAAQEHPPSTTQAAVAGAADVTDATVRARIKDLRELVD